MKNRLAKNKISLARTFVCTIAIVAVCVSSFGAQPPVPLAPPGSHASCWLQSSLLPTERATEARLVVSLRSANDFFSFVSNPTDKSASSFEAPYSLSIDVYDSSGVIRHGQLIRDTLRCCAYSETHNRSTTVLRYYSIIVPNTAYTVKLEIEQREGVLQRSSSSVLDLHAQKLFSSCSSPIFLQGSDHNGCLPLCVSAQGFDFGTDNVSLYYSCSSAAASRPLNYRVRRTKSSDEWYSDAKKEINGSMKRKDAVMLRTPMDSAFNDAPCFVAQTFGPDLFTLRADLEVASLGPGMYEFQAYSPASLDTLSTKFQIGWSTMPLCLKSLTTALSAMKYVATEDELESLSQGSEQDQRRQLISWWRKKDPSPSTVYNEAMIAFFRRVDESRAMFMTPAERDGMRTERGRVYILYGLPTDVEQTSPKNGAARETWTYSNKVKKRIVFERDQRDMYRIVNVESL